MVETTNQELITVAIQREIERRVAKAIDAELELARNCLTAALRAEADRIALSVLREYEIREHGERVTITVRKQI